MQETVKMTLKGKTFRKWANGQNIYDSENKLTQGVHLSLPWNYKHVYDIYSQTNLLVYIPELM